ncbi:12774_t:CDS:2, partial [Acaulospora colombiana]
LPIQNDQETRLAVMGLVQDASFDGFSGADLAALVREAGVIALRRTIKSWGSSIQGQTVTPSDTKVTVEFKDFESASTKVGPSVSRAQRKKYENLRTKFAGAVPIVELKPAMFNNLPNLTIQMSIQKPGDANTPAALQSQQIPYSITFKGKYDASQASNVTSTPFDGQSSESVTVVNNFTKQGLTKGQTAAAVLMPILFVAACIAGYVFWSRKKEASRRKEYRENLDQRMSIAPGADWAPISAAGAAAAIRHSMAGDRNTRASSFFGRQSSVYPDPPQEMRQTNRGRNPSTEQSRTSRISFADTTVDRSADRPAVPPLPAAYRKSAYTNEDEDSSPVHQTLSPTQRQGAFALDDDSIRDRLSGASTNNARASVADALGNDDTLPALAMMRANESPAPPAPVLTRESTAGDYRTYSIGAYSGNTDSIATDASPSYFNPPTNASNPDDALRDYASRTPQMVPVTTTASPFSGFAAGPGLAAAAGFDMSPDAVFRAYAATRPSAPPTTVAPGTPTTMRALYNPTMTQGLGLRQRADTLSSMYGNNNPYRASMAPSSASDDLVGKAQ